MSFGHLVRANVAMLLLLAGAWPTVVAAQSGPTKLKLRAELALTPYFCASQLKRGNGIWTVKEQFPVGEKLCPLLATELPALFDSLEKTDQVPAPNTTAADVVLIPKVVDIGATLKRKRELVVELEWTALNGAGKTLWVQTIQAAGQRKLGNAFSHGKNMRLICDDAVKGAVAKSEEAIRSAAPLLRPAQ